MKEKSIVLLTGLVTILIIISAGIAGFSSKAPSVSPVTQPVTTPTPIIIAITPIGDPALIELSIGETASSPERKVTVYSASKSRYYIWKDATSIPTYIYSKQLKKIIWDYLTF